MQELNQCIKVFIPSTSNAKEKNTRLQSRKVNETLEKFSKLFGGSTAYNATGAWLSTDHGLIKEKVVIVESFTTEESRENHRDAVLELCRKIKKDMQQEAVALQINNSLYFI